GAGRRARRRAPAPHERPGRHRHRSRRGAVPAVSARARPAHREDRMTEPLRRRTTPHELRAEALRLAYDGAPVIDGLDLELPDGRITAIVGANGCGKSTLLRGLSRLLKPRSGVVLLDGAAVHSRPAREVATVIGILPQQATAPEGITVADLVERRGEELSGGQRQRVWIAMALAQDPDVLLLDEPTTFLDLAHQLDVLDLLHEQNRTRHTTVAMVLHDLNMAARYADHLVV